MKQRFIVLSCPDVDELTSHGAFTDVEQARLTARKLRLQACGAAGPFILSEDDEGNLTVEYIGDVFDDDPDTDTDI